MKTLRLRDFDYAIENQTYFVTVRFDNPNGDLFLSELFKALKQLISETDFSCDALVVMADHAHFIVHKSSVSSQSLGDLMRRLKSKSVYLLKNRKLSVQSFWKRGYYERVIRDEHDWKTRMEYLIANPFRASITGDPYRYPYLFIKGFKDGATQGRPLRME
ncbi:MAG: transposase [Candidatus Zixiibacteriota bacterium]